VRLFVITTGTKDFGPAFVVREHRDLLVAQDPLSVCATLEEARGAIEAHCPSLVRLPPSAFDDRVIVESWGSRSDVDRCLAMQWSLERGKGTA
jgi:hypothetical protein